MTEKQNKTVLMVVPNTTGAFLDRLMDERSTLREEGTDV